MKIFLKIILSTIFLILIFILYVTFIGIETKRLNKQISSKIKNINNNLEIELKNIKITLSPLNLKINAKTIGTRLAIKDKTIEIENIKTQTSLLSFINNEFSLEDLEISTKSIKIKNLISFIREFNNSPQLYILEKIINRGYLIADIKLNFDKNGNITKDFRVNGFVKDTKIVNFKDFNIDKINFIFNLDAQGFKTEDITLNLNDLKFSSKKIFFKRKNEEFIIDGSIQNKDLKIREEQIKFIFKDKLPKFDIKNLTFNSKNNFSFKVDKKFKIQDFQLVSEVKIKDLIIENNLDIKKTFPKIKKEFNFLNQNLKINYSGKKLSIDGTGNILFQDKKDKINYSILKEDKIFKFSASLEIKNNPIILEILDYKTTSDSKTTISAKGLYDLNKEIILNNLSLNEKDNEFLAKNLVFNEKLQIINFEYIKLNYFDVDDQKNLVELKNKNEKFYLSGETINIDKFIDNLFSNDDQKNLDILNKKIDLNIDIKEVRLDEEHLIEDFIGNISFDKQKISNAKILANFSKNKKLIFTINSTPSGKVTTLFMDQAKPIVNRYKFIKGFEGGSLDFNSIQKGNENISTLKIYDFKLKELPALTKILTLASLQGIADILSGEGIRFNEFEMNFRSKDNLMTIQEIYAIGPAISVLMNGYVEKNKLTSLRGSLVPATTINKVIGSIPILGDILVGSKTGEGVFGVSFKIKGPPKNLETTVNPIKTLTPRFITRTLEGLKKS